MARKGTKIKRYGNIYGRGMGAGSWPILIAMIFGVVLFGVIGWSLYTPVHEFVMKLGTQPPPEPSSATTAVSSPATPESQQQQTPEPAPENTTSSQPADTAPTNQQEGMRGIYLPQAQLLDDTVLSNMLNSAAHAKLNTVVVDAKDATGTVLFSSENALAQKAGALADTTYSAQHVAKVISDKGFIPAARIHAFHDSIAPLHERDMAVHYYDTDIYWYDNSPNMGGKPWLNPYSQAAQQYIISLAGELCSQGFKIILLDSVQFPSGVGLDKAGYGTAAKTTAKDEVLTQFVEAISAAVKAKGGELILCAQEGWAPTGDVVRDAQIQSGNSQLYGGSPVGFFTSRVMLSLPSDDALWASALRNASSAASNTRWISIIPASASDGTLVDSTMLTAALENAGGNDYLLCNLQGNYKLQ
ncbi:putative glycoside hydrolase [Oscillospiraceae bacterium LTW-04]|nr:putative glycoside hydrolase [Oscillospiraceae bacterium MB24-C1]